MINQTLVFIQKQNNLLLGLKKRGFGEGRYNGIGGKVHDGESVVEAAKRECKEEIGVDVDALDQFGEVVFYPVKFPKGIKIYFFNAIDYRGEPTESEELKPEWFDKDKLPFDKMWDDDKQWMPLFLQGKKFTGTFWFDENDKVIRHELKEASKDEEIPSELSIVV
ncbi:hypothetical protein COS66_02955 [Candidatus Berkelbacteria bacterium CG06_land_8_20_14_3_00_43_10]|nr:MAG: hypothetical protein COS66_02955 [Candidatus Berkelbacteria bacterium CG06_land_8_20_14_3_00_43_10]